MKSIHIVTQWFPSEQEHAPIGHILLELSELLVKQVWEVAVITGFLNHPRDVDFDSYIKRLFQNPSGLSAGNK